MNSEATQFAESDGPAAHFQIEAEAGLNELIQVGGFDAAFLYSLEGLPLAKGGSSSTSLSELQIVELTVMIAKMGRVMLKLGVVDSVHELALESRQGYRVVFRFMTVFSQPALLILVVPPQKSYRGLTNRIARVIEKWATFAE
jgi:hypothetical protein